MRTIICSLLLLFSAFAGSVVVDTDNSALAPVTLQSINPATTPVTRISGTLTFNAAAPLDPGETVLVTAYNAAGVEVGSSSYTNSYSSVLASCACIDITTTVPLSDVTFSVSVQAVGGARFNINDTVVVSPYTASGPSSMHENLIGTLAVAGSPPGACEIVPTADGCPCPNGQAGTYPSCGAAASFGLIYSRAHRWDQPSPTNELIDEQASAQKFTNVYPIHDRISEADMVYNDLNGIVRVIENCTEDFARGCAAVEGRVSPDGTAMIYSLIEGDLVSNNSTTRPQVEYVRINNANQGARLFHYVFETQVKTALPWTPGDHDRYPEWINNNKIVFSSTRGQTFPTPAAVDLHRGLRPNGSSRRPNSVGTAYDGFKSMQLWTMDVPSGANAKNITPHEQMALRPFVDKKGDIYFSCWEAGGPKRNYTNTSTASTTGTNLFWICRTDQNGGDQTSVMGAHRHNLPGAMSASGVVKGTDALALRSVAEDSAGRLYATSYYRGNHNGAGWIIRWDKNENPRIEGCSTDDCLGVSAPGSAGFVPTDSFHHVTPYGMGQDQPTQRHAGNNKVMGKAGYPSAVPGGGIMISHCRGACRVDDVTPESQNIALLGGEPTADFGIWQVLADQVVDPFTHLDPNEPTQMIPLVDHPDYHEWDADVVAPYSDIYGIPQPAQQTALVGTECYINVVDARNNEIYAKTPYDFAGIATHCSKQGCAIGPDVINQSTEIAGLMILENRAWTDTVSRTRYLGNNYHETSIIGTAPMQADGSIRMQVPCDTPFLMSGIDSSWRAISHDPMPHSLRPGEERTCHGCHDGHSTERDNALGNVSAESRFVGTIAASLTPTLPATPYERLTFTADILPIIESRCESCHTEFTPLKNSGLLYDAIALDHEQLDFPSRYQGATGKNGNNPSLLPRPWYSPWVNRFARESLFYWKCMNARTDARTDATYNDDIDFGPSHPTAATPAECATIARWIDSGAEEIW